MSATRLVDLGHTIEDGMVTYKGLPAPIICDYLSHLQSREKYAPGTEFQIGKVTMTANTGTYIDSPFHRFAHGADIAALPLESIAALDGVVIHAETAAERAIGPEAFTSTDVARKAVLVHTGWDVHWRSERYFEGHPFLTAAAAEWLRDAGAVLVGIDSLNVDDTRGGERPVHTILLAAGIPIVEHLCGLEQLPSAGFEFTATPARVKGMGSFPVRAWARF
ncbi:MAG TPA: cyclase family protein [Woeseiaceae bacterium]|nr:cyclase family protein [Woeseiaceae bacterium]